MIKVEHIGIAVREIDGALDALQDLVGETPYKAETVERDGVRTHFLGVGTVKLELLESTRADSPIARFLDKRGEGLHHVAFEVDDIDDTYRRVESLGYQPLDDAPRPGADGKRIFFLHPKDTAGVLIEFCQAERSVLEPASSSGSLRIRRAGMPDRPGVAYFHGSESALDMEALARSLEPHLTFWAFEVSSESEWPDVSDFLKGRTLHLLASGDQIPLALQHSDQASTVILCNPRIAKVGSLPSCPVLIIGDSRAQEPAMYLRSMLEGSSLAILPELEADMIARLIVRHAGRS